MKNDEERHVCKVLPKYEFVLNPSSSASSTLKVFNEVKKIHALIIAISCYSFKLNINTQPFAGLPSFGIILHGYALVKFFPLQVSIDLGESLSTFNTMINALDDTTELDKWPCIGVPCGQGFYCPFGWIPIVMGIEKTHEAGDSIIVYTLSPILDESYKNASLEVTSDVKQWIERNLMVESRRSTPEIVQVVNEYLMLFPKPKAVEQEVE